jgi:hypothetical protein
MSIGNLRGMANYATSSVNPNIRGQWSQSTGNTVATGGSGAGKQTPTYAAAVDLVLQVQPVTTGDIKRYAFLSGQGIFRSVYMFGNKDAIDRSRQLGGDLLLFPQRPGLSVQTWLVKEVPEVYNPDAGWCRVIVVLQLDPNNP